jgi:hypothetical protein
MYYPDQRYASALTVIRRECVLPEDVLGTVRIAEGKRVDIRDVVANGVTPTRYVILDAMDALKLRKPEALEGLMLVEPGEVVDAQQALAGKSPTRGRRVFAPFRGIVVRLDRGRIILQEIPEVIDLQAGVRGRIARIYPGRGVSVEAVGGLVQGVWGNNRRTIATLRIEPEAGLASILSADFEMRYAGALVVTRQPLTSAGLEIMAEQSFAGIVAPSMDAGLRDAALEASGAILLTEGFGTMRMSVTVFNLLEEMEGHQVTIDAQMPSRWEPHSPALIINVPVKGDERPSRPNVMLSLRPGIMVRITRAPHAGSTGRVVDLPKSLTLLDNGLRVPCAQVELVTGEVVFVPLANLEVLGR